MLPFLLTLTLSLNLNHGALLELSDGSRWTIQDEDIPITALWLVPMEIIVQQTTTQTYPYQLNNVATSQKVQAKKVSN
jgi:hypothetical protein